MDYLLHKLKMKVNWSGIIENTNCTPLHCTAQHSTQSIQNVYVAWKVQKCYWIVSKYAFECNLFKLNRIFNRLKNTHKNRKKKWIGRNAWISIFNKEILFCILIVLIEKYASQIFLFFFFENQIDCEWIIDFVNNFITIFIDFNISYLEWKRCNLYSGSAIKGNCYLG